MDFSLKVWTGRAVEEENSPQMNSHLAVIVNIAGVHHEKA